MEGNLYIMLPVHPAVFAAFLAILALSLIYYAVKFVVSLVTGG